MQDFSQAHIVLSSTYAFTQLSFKIGYGHFWLETCISERGINIWPFFKSVLIFSYSHVFPSDPTTFFPSKSHPFNSVHVSVLVQDEAKLFYSFTSFTNCPFTLITLCLLYILSSVWICKINGFILFFLKTIT